MSSPGPHAETVRSTERSPASGSQVSLTLLPRQDEGIGGMCERLAGDLRKQGAAPLHLLVYGDVRASAPTRREFQRIFGRVNWPITWVDGAALDGRPIAGIQAHAFTGRVEPIESKGRVVGAVFTESGAKHCVVGGMTPADPTLSRAAQTHGALEDLQAVLAQAGFELEDTVRTWFFLDDILSWYADFNRVRTKIYSGLKFHTGSMPASTGVGARNPDGAALALAAWAFRPLEGNACAREVASPLQCPAPAYGSAFSRAMEVVSGARRRLLISGTASIAPGGETLWPGDIRRQVELTMEVVGAILRSRAFSFADLTRATAYFRRRTEAGAFADWLNANHAIKRPVALAQCDICRENLLFEVEVEAERPLNGSQP